MNDGSHTPQKPLDPQYDHVKNLECVPNQEVLPSETHSSPETRRNLESPDSIPRPMRSASVSSNYSNMSHGSGTGNHWHQGVAGTASRGYFGPIDSSPGGDMRVRQSLLEQMWQPTPGPSKPTGIFWASTNSSFEPVRSQGVGVCHGFDIGTSVAEGAASGTVEQPPNPMENIHGPGHPLLEQVVAVIQPPADGSLDLQPSSWRHSENPENPPKERDAESADFQGNIGYPAPPVNPPAPVSNQNQPSNYELLDFSMHQSKIQKHAPGHSSSLHESPQSSSGFYIQVTKDAQQGVRMEGSAPVQNPASSTIPQVLPAPTQAAVNTEPEPRQPPNRSDPHAALQAQSYAHYVPVSGAQPPHGQCPPPYPGHVYDSYYGNYEYPDGRGPFLDRYLPPPPGDLRAHQYYHGGPYTGRADPWYGQYDGRAYHDLKYQYRAPQSVRPSSRTSLYSDRPSARQGHFYGRANQSAYAGNNFDYSRNYDYRGYNYGQYDPRYKDQSYWANYDNSYRDYYYNQHTYPSRKEGYEDQQQYYCGYNSGLDGDGHGRINVAGDDFGRCRVSQVYQSQPDLVSAVTASTLAVDHSFGQCPNQADATQNYSQYTYPSERTEDGTWIAQEEPSPRRATPEKFTIPHRCARFGPGGHLVQVLPNLPSAGQRALVDIYNLETMLQNTLDQIELRAFPGPLAKEDTHKVDVIKFAQNKALECSRDNNLLDRDSARLLWDFIVLLCRQNGTVVGTDIADLLLKEHRSVWLPGKSLNEATLIDFNDELLARAEEEPGAGPLSLLSDTFMVVPENIGKETERFRDLLLFGRKKDALEAAMKGGLWGHALLLASKMDNRTHARVMTRFANSLPFNDPLQTVYQLMSGRMPASATCCGEEKWGDWRPHLSMVLSNLTHTLDLDTRTITTMGDTLASKGLIDAAHFCYMMAQVDLGVFTKKSAKMVLIGSNHSSPFYPFATIEAIQRTEAYEYAQSLGSHSCSLPNFQVFKLIYACRLAEAGLSAQAFHYCEVISKTVLMQPSFYSPVLISQIIQLSEKLRLFDPQLKEKPEQELFNEPEWLIQLRQLDGQIRTGVITYTADRISPTHFGPSDLDQPSPHESYSMPLEVDCPAPNSPLMSSLLPGPPPQGVQLMFPAPRQPQSLPHSDVPQFYPVVKSPPGQMQIPDYPPQDPGFQPPPEHSELYPPAHQQQRPPQMPYSPVQGQFIPQPISNSPPRNFFTPEMDSSHMAPVWHSESSSVSPAPSAEQPSREEENKVNTDSQKKSGGGFFEWIFGKGKNEAHLPDDKNPSIVWDVQMQRWVNLNEPDEENKPPPSPPPAGFPMMAPMPGPGGPGGPTGPPTSVNMFSRRADTRSRYVDVLNPGKTAKPGGFASAPADIFAPLAPMPMPANLFVPGSEESHNLNEYMNSYGYLKQDFKYSEMCPTPNISLHGLGVEPC